MRHLVRLAPVLLVLGLSACGYQFAGINPSAVPAVGSRDIGRLTASPESQAAVIAEIASHQDEARLDAALAELLAATGSAGGQDLASWQALLPGMDFQQRLQLLGVLAAEQQRLRALDRETR